MRAKLNRACTEGGNGLDKPEPEELWLRERLLGDEATMSYNRCYEREDKMDEIIAKAWSLFDAGDLNGARALYLDCLSTARADELAPVWMGLIYVESGSGNFDSARQYASRLLGRAQSKEDEHIALHQSGMVERMAGEYARALELFEREAEIIRDALQNEDMSVSVNLYEQGYVRLKMGDADSAGELLERSLACARRAEDPMCIGCALRALGETMAAKGEREQALCYFQAAAEAFREVGDSRAVEEVEELWRQEG